MARPKQWQNVEGSFTLAPDYLEVEGRHHTRLAQLGTRRMARWNSDRRNLFYRTPNGYNDPISVAFVLDALLRIPPERPIRATWLTMLLNKEYDTVVWDPTCVGRILGEIALESYEEAKGNVHRMPVRRAQDYKGAYFWLAPTNLEIGLYTEKWLSDRREWMGRKARDAAKGVRRGQQSVKSRRGAADMIWAGYEAAA